MGHSKQIEQYTTDDTSIVVAACSSLQNVSPNMMIPNKNQRKIKNKMFGHDRVYANNSFGQREQTKHIE